MLLHINTKLKQGCFKEYPLYLLYIKAFEKNNRFLLVVILGLLATNRKIFSLGKPSVKISKVIVGRIIKQHRLKKGLTQQDLADKLNVDKQYVWKLENGKINMSLDYLDKVMKELGVTVQIS